MKPSGFTPAILLGLPAAGLLVAVAAFHFAGLELRLADHGALLLVLALLLLGLAVLVIHLRRRAERQALERLAALLGIELLPGPTSSPARIEGRVAAGTVRIQTDPEGLVPGTRVTLLPHVAPRLELSRDDSHDAPGARPLDSGDPRLDPLLRIKAPVDPLEHALLDAKTRDALAALLEAFPHRLCIASDRASLVIPGLDPPPWALKNALRAMYAVVEPLSRHVDIVDALAKNVLEDRDVHVRAKNLAALCAHFPSHAATHAALERSVRDPAWELRIQAAQGLGAAGIPILRDVADEAPEPWPARAVAALGRIGDPSINDLLLETLEHPRTPELQQAAVEALGHTGDRRCVEPLYHLAQEGPWTMRATARASIQQIQSRLGPVEAGWLSLDVQDPRAGALTIASEAGEGALSLAETTGEGALRIVDEAGEGALVIDPEVEAGGSRIGRSAEEDAQRMPPRQREK